MVGTELVEKHPLKYTRQAEDPPRVCLEALADSRETTGLQFMLED